VSAFAIGKALILRSPPKAGVSKDEGLFGKTSWFETRRCAALLTMRFLGERRG